jgi:hypothetical protein
VQVRSRRDTRRADVLMCGELFDAEPRLSRFLFFSMCFFLYDTQHAFLFVLSLMNV